MSTTIDTGLRPFEEVNAEVRRAIDAGESEIVLTDVNGQRYIASALPRDTRITIHGVPGNDLGCYMAGGTIEVLDNAQDQIANTMNEGLIVVHGHCGDAAGYAMRGGSLYVRDDVGWRCGIHMKEYGHDARPMIVIGGNAGSFLGEYMAGGVILLMGSPDNYLASGMHGGVMYLHGGIDDALVSPTLLQEECDAADLATIADLTARYNRFFGTDKPVRGELYTKLRPRSSRPYSGMYTTAD